MAPPPPTQLLLGTSSRKKLGELLPILGGAPLTLVTPADLGLDSGGGGDGGDVPGQRHPEGQCLRPRRRAAFPGGQLRPRGGRPARGARRALGALRRPRGHRRRADRPPAAEPGPRPCRATPGPLPLHHGPGHAGGAGGDGGRHLRRGDRLRPPGPQRLRLRPRVPPLPPVVPQASPQAVPPGAHDGRARRRGEARHQPPGAGRARRPGADRALAGRPSLLHHERPTVPPRPRSGPGRRGPRSLAPGRPPHPRAGPRRADEAGPRLRPLPASHPAAHGAGEGQGAGADPRRLPGAPGVPRSLPPAAPGPPLRRLPAPRGAGGGRGLPGPGAGGLQRRRPAFEPG